jgi:hypothetical protein
VKPFGCACQTAFSLSDKGLRPRGFRRATCRVKSLHEPGDHLRARPGSSFLVRLQARLSHFACVRRLRQKQEAAMQSETQNEFRDPFARRLASALARAQSGKRRSARRLREFSIRIRAELRRLRSLSVPADTKETKPKTTDTGSVAQHVLDSEPTTRVLGRRGGVPHSRAGFGFTPCQHRKVHSPSDRRDVE